jgi:multidrug transporter EmrE-like cation transporter
VPASLLVILVGLLSTTQNHLAKALERQGIEIYDHLHARLRGQASEAPRSPAHGKGSSRKPLIYILGLVLNHTTFLYHLLVVPLGGTTALYTSMYGMGLVALLLYSTLVMKEQISRLELVGATAILFGTLMIGLDGISRPTLSMSQMDLHATLLAIGLVLATCAGLIWLGLHQVSASRLDGASNHIGLVFGLSAGMCGSLDPFMKGVGQSAGGGGGLAPQQATGWWILAGSFLIGEAAVVITQWGFIRRARANRLVPAYNCSYIGLPVLLQSLLLPGYILDGLQITGLALILLGIIVMRALKPENRSISLPVEGENNGTKESSETDR